MEEIESIDHQANNENYIIRLYQTLDVFIVISFKDNQRITPTYSVSNMAANDFELYHELKAYEALIDLAKRDIDEGLYWLSQEVGKI